MISSVGVLRDGDADDGGRLLFHIPCGDDPAPRAPAHAVVATLPFHEGDFLGIPLIVLDSMQDLVAALDVASRTMADYETWVRDLYRTAAGGQPLSALLDQAVSYLHNPIYVADNNFRMVECSGDDPVSTVDPVWRYHARYRYLPYSVTRDLVETGEFERIDGITDATLFDDTATFPTPFICAPILQGGVRVGNLVVLGLNRRLHESDCELVDFLSSVITLAIDDERGLEGDRFSPAHFIVDVMTGNLTDVGSIELQLSFLGWGIEGDYAVFVADTAGKELPICQQLLTATQDLLGQAFLHERRIVVIANQYAERKEMLDGLFERLTGSFGCRCALSEPFIMFTDVGICYRQALFALGCDVGEGGLDRPALVRYEDVFTRHLTQLTGDALPTLPSVARLARYDAENATSLCETLLVWLSTRGNTVETARQLFVHRNTVNYRLERICEVTGMRLDEVSGDLRMLIALINQMHRARASEGSIPEGSD